MKLSSMRYKRFVWPHNPRVYTITFERGMAVHKVPFQRYKLQGLGMTQRVMRGEGEFVGEDAYRQFKELASVFYENTPGALLHPLWDISSAWFVRLELAQEPRENYVSYRFEFWEDYAGYQTGVEKLSAPAPQQTASGTQQVPEAGNSGVAVPWGQTGGEAMQAARKTRYHTVTKGQTMWGIAQGYGVTVDELISMNAQIKNPNLIQVGEKVWVP